MGIANLPDVLVDDSSIIKEHLRELIVARSVAIEPVDGSLGADVEGGAIPVVVPCDCGGPPAPGCVAGLFGVT